MSEPGEGAGARSGLPRLVEIPLAAAGLLLAAPLLALAAGAIALTSRGPVFFRQERVGLRGRRFVLVKLRTMRPAAGSRVTARDDPRVTAVGRVLRRSKIDELPALWNVLRGDLSLVGPRPEVPELVDLESPAWQEALRVRPGLTDPMTLRLRDEESLMASVPGDRMQYYRDVLQPEKLRGYADYLRRRSWHSDLMVLGQTALAVCFPPLARGRNGSPHLPEGPAGA
jgi:lipopolysaccharide/colanic/teichoic acid biosynthesis glycosyltransferase